LRTDHVSMPQGRATEGQPSPARSLTLIVIALATLAGAGFVGVVVGENVVLERITGLPVSLPWLFGGFAAAAVILGILVVDRLYDLVQTQRQQLSGAKMHGRVAVLLSVVALAPAAVAFSLTGIIVSAFTDEFFVERMDETTSVARNLANAYADSVGRQMLFNISLVEREVFFALESGISPEKAPIGYRKYLNGMAALYQFSELTHVDAAGRVVARTALSGDPVPLPPPSQLSPAVRTDGSLSSAPFGFVEQAEVGTYFIVMPLGRGEYGYLIGYRRELPRIYDGLIGVQELRDENRQLQRRATQIGTVANNGFLLLSVVLLLAALWIGLLVANAVVGPIRRLATAADRVSSGDLQSRVEVRQRDGELGDLGRSFNQMTERLAAQRKDLIAAGEDAENRRRFIETMLAAIPAGVISVSREGDVGLANPSAALILGRQPGDLVGQPLAAVVPPAAPLFDVVRSTGKGMRESVEWSRRDDVRSLVIEISPEAERGEDGAGFVITIEDITELLTAQRTAAWGDVARRIAHEIKNPLTPIQLSAERLRRRYAKDLEGRDREIFDQCTETIIRHVGDIGRMVTEFSSFARMPEPIMAENDLREIAKEAIFPFGVAHPAVEFVSILPDGEVPVLCDNRLIVQALTNMIKNAVESIEENEITSSGRIEMEVAVERTGARIEVRDNGLGLPEKFRHRLTEPYMTTRAKGTGLGLAIVRKAVEDHDGSFTISDREGGGAEASLFLPTLQKDPESADRDISATVPGEEPALHGH